VPPAGQASALAKVGMTTNELNNAFGIEISPFTGAGLLACVFHGGAGRSGFADRFFAGTVSEVGSLLRGNDSQGERGGAGGGELTRSHKPDIGASLSLGNVREPQGMGWVSSRRPEAQRRA